MGGSKLRFSRTGPALYVGDGAPRRQSGALSSGCREREGGGRSGGQLVWSASPEVRGARVNNMTCGASRRRHRNGKLFSNELQFSSALNHGAAGVSSARTQTADLFWGATVHAPETRGHAPFGGNTNIRTSSAPFCASYPPHADRRASSKRAQNRRACAISVLRLA